MESVMTKYALLVGLREVNPKAYYGWNGRGGCEGCEKDVSNVHDILSDYKFDSANIKSLLTAEATREQVLNNLKTAAATCKAGDMFVFYYTGHGGQVKDLNGDEVDGKDETLVCYDGELIDDDLNKVWVTFPEGVRIVMMTDCCNSETNYRSSIINQREIRNTGLGNIAENLVERSDIKAMMIHVGACSDGDTALGYKNGGLFTQTIKKILDANTFTGTYQQLVDEILLRTADFDQEANYSEYGPVESDAFNLFRNSRLFADNIIPSLVKSGGATLFAKSEEKREQCQTLSFSVKSIS